MKLISWYLKNDSILQTMVSPSPNVTNTVFIKVGKFGLFLRHQAHVDVFYFDFYKAAMLN